MEEEQVIISDSENESEWNLESSSGSDWSENEGKRRQQENKRKLRTQSCKEKEQTGIAPIKKTEAKRKRCQNSGEFLGQQKKNKPLLAVTCGDKEGFLNREKFYNWEKCILSEGQWFKPTDFEKFGGKEKTKKWRTSIFYRGVPLQKLIEDELLLNPVSKKIFQDEQINSPECSPVAGRLRKKKYKPEQFVQLSASSAEDSSADSETSAGTEEERDAEDLKKQRTEGEIEFRGREEEEDIEELSVFQDSTLPVTCVLSGTLHKSRFVSGLCGKCIQTDKSWHTPEEFVMQMKTLTDASWRRDILCHGKTLNFLLQKEILCIHSHLYKCKKCSNREHDLKNDDECYECYSEGDLVCCDECPRAFHPDCHLPAINRDSPGKWMCTFCELRTNQQWRDYSHMTKKEALKLTVSSQYRLYCDYLLLYVYREDVQRVFVKDPRKTVRRYSEFIDQPMWLDRIKMKLKKNEYQTVGDFVSDFQLIFSNCSTFNGDNKFGKMGARLKDLFDRKFQKIFTIQ